MKKHDALYAEINNTSLTTGKLTFWWLGQHSFIVRTANHTLYFDMFFSMIKGRVFPPLLDASEISNADYIFGSHDHDDHIDRAYWPVLACNNPNAKFVVPKLLVDSISSDTHVEKERFIGVDENIVYEDNGIVIHGVPAAHEFLDPDPVTGLHPYTGFVVETDGVRIYHSGDCCRYEGLETKLKSFGKIDLMMLPINGRDGLRYHQGIIGNMTYQEAADLAGAIMPRLIVPAHYDMVEGNRAMTEAILFAEFVDAKYPGLQYWIGSHAQKVEV